MAIDREAMIRIRVALTGGEAGTAIDRIVSRLEAVEKRMGLIGKTPGAAGGAVPLSQSPLAPNASVMHISPIPLPTRVTNFADARDQQRSSTSYDKIQAEPRYQAQPPRALEMERSGPIHIDPTPLPVKVLNFADMNTQRNSPGAAGPGAAPSGFWQSLKGLFGLGAPHMAGGGVIQRRLGSGGDDEPCYLTPGERVIPVDVSKRHAAALDAMTGDSPHMAGGGVMGGVHDWMKKRYGAKTLAASAMIGQVASWGATAGLTAMTGTPIMTFGMGPALTLPVAEMIHRLKSKSTLQRERDEEHQHEQMLERDRRKFAGLPQFSASGASHYDNGGIFPGMPVNRTGSASEKHARHVQTSLGSLDQRITDLMHRSGVAIHATGTTEEMSPLTVDAGGFYNRPTRRVAIAERVKRGRVTPAGVEKTMRHEIGHAIDHALNRPSLEEGQNSYADAVAKDVAGMTESDKQRYTYYLTGTNGAIGNAGPGRREAETFAENFAHLTRPNADLIKSARHESTFANSLAWMRAHPELQSLGIGHDPHYAAGGIVLDRIKKFSGMNLFKDYVLPTTTKTKNPLYKAMGEHYAGGGEVQQRNGTGGDDELAYLTPGERVIPKQIAQRHKAMLDWMTGNDGGAGNARHYASGGTAGAGSVGISSLAAYLVQDVRCINFMDLPQYLPKAGGGGGSPKGPGETGFWSGAAGAFGGASRVAGAAGAGATQEISGSLGGVASAAAAGGPAGIAVAGVVASLVLAKVGIEKWTAALEISKEPFLTGAQKRRAMEDEFIPFATKLHALADAIDGVNARIGRSNATTEREINKENAAFRRDAAKLGLETRANEFRGQAAGMNSASLATGQVFDTMTYRGQVQRQEQDITLAAADASVNAQRGVAGARETLRLNEAQAARLSANSIASDLAAGRANQRSREAMAREGRIVPLTTGQRISALPGAIGGDPLQQMAAFGGIGIGRDKAGRTEADNAAHAANLKATNALILLQQQQEQVTRSRLELQRQENEAAKVGLGIRQAELQIMQLRSQRMQADVSGLGSMGRGEYRQSQKALQMVQRRGQAGFDRLSPELIQRAGRAPGGGEIVRNMQNVLGQERAQAAGRAGTGGEQFQLDWQRGAAALGDTQNREQALAQTIRQELDAVSVRSANNLAATFTATMDNMVRILDRAFAQALANWEQRFRQTNNNQR